MSDRHHDLLRPVDEYKREKLGTRAIRPLKSRTSETTRQRIQEQARTLRNHNFAVGVEIVPNKLVAVLTDPTGQNYGRRTREVANMKVSTVVREIGVMVRELVATSLGVDLPSRRVAVGMQIGGPVNASEGVVLSWRNHPTDPRYAVHPDQWTTPVPLASLVEAETGCPTVIENDAAAYAAYELRFGAGNQAESFAIILIRDGVGGGIVMGHRVLSIPFEIGHLIFRSDGRICACGNRGCIEAYAGRRAIRGIVAEHMGGLTDADDIGAAIARASHSGSSDVLNVFREGGEAIAHGIATILTIFGVERVVIYCDPEMCGPNLQKAPVAEFFAGVDTYPTHTFSTFKNCTIEHREWHSFDGALGAALVALNQLYFVPLVSP